MKNRSFASFVLGCLLVLLPSLLSAGPWDPNRARPPGFQRTLAYLEKDLYDYPQANLQSTRNLILTEDLITAMIEPLKQQGPPSSWEAVGQQTIDAYTAQYEGIKKTLRQTKSDPEGIIRAVEGNQSLSSELQEDELVRALIMGRWMILGISERIYQAMLYAKGDTGSPGGSPPSLSVPTIPSPKKAKSNVLDYKRMRQTREAAIKRRKEIEARRAREAAERWEELNQLLRILIGNQAQSTNKFKQTQKGSALTIPQLGEIGPPEPAEPPAPATKPPEDTTKEDTTTEPEKAQEQPAEKPAAKRVKIKIYHGTFTLTRLAGWEDDNWHEVRAAFKKDTGQTPGVSGLNDAGDVLTWQYKGKVPGDKLLAQYPPMFVYTPGETTEEEVLEDGSEPPAEPEKKGFEDNEPLTKYKDTEDPGNENLRKKLAPAEPNKPAAKPEPKPAAVTHDGYWFDPTDESRDDDDPYIYVRANGVANRIQLSKAPATYGIPDKLTIDQMSWYNERQHKLEKNYNNTHRSPGAQSTNKFAKPKN